MKKQSYNSFSLLELMVVVSIICMLAVVAIPSYRAYTIKASIAALTSTADTVKNEVEDAHNQGTVFGTTGNQTYIASNAADRPFALLDVIRVNYGCVDIGIDLSALNLDSSQQLTMTWCPTVNNGEIDWQCGYEPTSDSAYIQYLPAICQQSSAAIQDTAF